MNAVKRNDTKWIVCEKCKCSYELDNNELIDDFEDCECGGKLDTCLQNMLLKNL